MNKSFGLFVLAFFLCAITATLGIVLIGDGGDLDSDEGSPFLATTNSSPPAKNKVDSPALPPPQEPSIQKPISKPIQQNQRAAPKIKKATRKGSGGKLSRSQLKKGSQRKTLRNKGTPAKVAKNTAKQARLKSDETKEKYLDRKASENVSLLKKWRGIAQKKWDQNVSSGHSDLNNPLATNHNLNADLESESPLTQETDDENKDDDEVAEVEVIPFNAFFQSESGEALAGVVLISSDSGLLNEIKKLSEGAGGSSGLSSGDFPVAYSDENGYCSFFLPQWEGAVLLEARYAGKGTNVYHSPITMEYAWNQTVITLQAEVSGATVKGRVLDKWGKAISQVFVFKKSSNAGGAEAQSSELKTVSDSNGEYILQNLPIDEAFELACVHPDFGEMSLLIPALFDGEVSTDHDFLFSDSKTKAGIWNVTLVDESKEPLNGLYVSLSRYASYLEASGQSDVVQSNLEGQVTLDEVKPETLVTLYVYHPDLDVLVVETRSFSSGENYKKSYTIKKDSDEPAQIGFRLQDSEGVDIPSGWLATEPIFSSEALADLLSRGGFGTAVIAGETTWIKNIPPREAYIYHYTDEKGKSIELGEYTLKGGEKRHVALVRLPESFLEKQTYSASISDLEGEPVTDLKLSAQFDSGEFITSTHSDQLGFFSLEFTLQKRLIKIWGENQSNVKKVLYQGLITDLMDQEGRIYLWTGIENSLVVRVLSSSGSPIEGAYVNLSSPSQQYTGIHSNSSGLSVVSDIQEGSYSLSVSHAFYETHEVEEFTPNLNEEINEVRLKAKSGVKVRLVGPDFSEGFQLRAWLGVLRDGSIFPDNSRGNEYGEKLEDPEMLFLTPAENNFWIYVGGMKAPWGAGLHGPFSHSDENSVIEIELTQVQPITIDTRVMGKNAPKWWDIVIAARIPNTQETSQLVSSQQSPSANRQSFYLIPGDYQLMTQGEGFARYSTDFSFVKKSLSLPVKMEKYDFTTPDGGFVRSYLLSDKFGLVLSIENNYHHGEQCYGFSTDHLKHLSGEARFRAVDFGEYLNQDGTGLITWRKKDFASGTLDFKSIYPGATGDYSVAYAQFRVKSSTRQKVLLAISSDDGLKAWYEGKKIEEYHVGRPSYTDPNQDQIRIELVIEPGQFRQFNFKVDNSWGKWELRTRFLDPNSLEPITDLILDPPGGFTEVISQDLTESGNAMDAGGNTL